MKKFLKDNNIDERERPELKEINQHYLEYKKNDSQPNSKLKKFLKPVSLNLQHLLQKEYP